MPITKVNSLGVSLTSPVTFPAGTVSLPSITTSGDLNTGAFFPAADTIAFTEGGTEALRINSDAQTVHPLGTALLPSMTFTGDVNTGIFSPTANTLAFTTDGGEGMRILPARNLRFPALGSGSGASSTAYLLDTTYPNALIFVAGQENLPVNMSFYMGIAVRSSSTYTLTQIAKPAHGNGFGTVNVAMNGNYLNISFAAGSGNYAVNVMYFFG
jgi:hypothetical protein